MSKIDPERAALMARIKIAAAALEIPQEAVDHVIKHGSSRHLCKALDVLVAFASEYGISLDYLISGNLDAMFRAASPLMKATRPVAA